MRPVGRKDRWIDTFSLYLLVLAFAAEALSCTVLAFELWHFWIPLNLREQLI